MVTREKLAALRALMRKNKIDAYYIPSVDPHQSEYVPAWWRRRAWLSGFTGSAGDVLVTMRKAGLWTDGRYFLQAESQLADSGIDLMRMGLPGVPSLLDWAATQLRSGQVLGVDPRVMSMSGAREFSAELDEKGIEVRYLEENLVDSIWADQPEPSASPLRIHPDSVAGEKVESKLDGVRRGMRDAGAKAHVIGSLDQIAWLFNIRGSDVEYNPLAVSYAIVTDRGASLFVDPRKVGKTVRARLMGKAVIKAYDAVGEELKKIAARGLDVLVDPATVNQWVADKLRGAEILAGPSPVTLLKSIKNPAQIAGTKAAHVRDGVAMVRFLRWLEDAVPAGGVTEISAAEKLRGFRAKGQKFQDLSFGTISAYGANGAIIHYEPTPEHDAKLKPRGLYLVDSGGQYLDGTTDITRTVALGKPTAEMKRMFTAVLKGNINLTLTPFPRGWSGGRLEVLARQALWMAGVNYNHGTGHGVGHYLNVHEGPMAISFRDHANVPMAPGQLLSIEPGHYEPGKFGIRIENLAFVADAPDLGGEAENWCRWDVVTLCPIDLTLVDPARLAPAEIAWLNDYHKRVYRELSPHLDRADKSWLKRATSSI